MNSTKSCLGHNLTHVLTDRQATDEWRVCATCSSDFSPELPDENNSSKFEPKITENSRISNKTKQVRGVRSDSDVALRHLPVRKGGPREGIHTLPHKVPFSFIPVPTPDISCEKSRGIRSAALWRTRTRTWRTRCRGSTSTPPSLSLRGELHQPRLPRTTQVGA